jgi:mono/diheme cytochrome c family protein
MKIVLIILAAVFCFVSTAAFAHEGEHMHGTQSHRHMEYAKEKNPIPMDEKSVMRGKELYEQHCIGCHGKRGKAAGRLDLTKPVFIHGPSDGEIYHVITDGVGETAMKSFKKELTKKMRWDLVNYIKSLKQQNMPVTAPR